MTTIQGATLTSMATTRNRTPVNRAISPHRLCSALLTSTIPSGTALAGTAASSIATTAGSQTIPTRTTAAVCRGATPVGTAAAAGTLAGFSAPRLVSHLSLALRTALARLARLLRTAATAPATSGANLAGLVLTPGAALNDLASGTVCTALTSLAHLLRATTPTAAGLAGLRHA